ncbi:MAG TPA: 2-amino-4-hydroxy-6-hydroxymethyldihydropteridine diphosphokinase [Terracidiphilus sp.]|nr:2-amino-4-hydroxy-6-hydroxymethyldihydropteridine diphosphokinase [Terracidiphilus sp.]
MRTAYIGLGGNLPGPAGPPPATFAAALAPLAALGQICARSPLYSTAPVGIPDQPRFFNAVVALQTSLAPRVLLHRLLAIEKAHGRDRSRSTPNGPRTLDLDLLLLGDLCLSESGLELPHPRLAQRAFVLVPLAQVAPNLVDPRSRRTIAQLLSELLELEPSQADAVSRIDSELWSPLATINS